jgi:hypothetical protein
MMAAPRSAWSGCGLESGDVVDREVEDHGNAVAVLPFDLVRRTALLVRILRAPAFLGTGRSALLECPAGLTEEADPAETARREAYGGAQGNRRPENAHAGAHAANLPPGPFWRDGRAVTREGPRPTSPVERVKLQMVGDIDENGGGPGGSLRKSGRPRASE